MFGILPALVLALAAGSDALMPHPAAQLRRHAGLAQNSYTPRTTSYKLVKQFKGSSFFDDWNFFTDADPTHGLVDYVGGDDAKSLAYVQSDGTAVIAVDQSTNVPSGGKRKSIRISTKDSWARGLFIADIYAMPHGCSVWPAYWSLGEGATWPDAGEIDIIENVNEATANQITLHSGPGCTLNKATTALAKLISTTCESANGNNAGCAYAQTTQNNTYGHGFNMQAGGVYAHTLESDAISVWYFDRNQIPADITAGKPDPSSWGTPTAFFPNTNCDISKHFLNQSLIFDITICGDWAGPAFSATCPGTCEDAVADASNFAVAQWKIGSVSVYQ